MLRIRVHIDFDEYVSEKKIKFLYEERDESMGFDQYHELASELLPETRTIARMIASLTEEAEAIGWYEQRLAVGQNEEAWAIIVEHGEEAEEAEHQEG